jgi:hypothetical protein
MDAVLDVKWLPGRYRAPDRVRDGGQVFGHREKGVDEGTGRDEVARSIAGDRLDAVADELEMPGPTRTASVHGPGDARPNDVAIALLIIVNRLSRSLK